MIAARQTRPIEILMVEDNPGTVRLTQEVMRESKVRNAMHTVDDGVEAMAFLRRQGRYASMPRPDLVLLDLNLPRKDGRETLAEMKGDAALKRIPVVVLTTSKSEEDIVRAYDLHANCYLTKPVGLEDFITVVKSIENFWIEIVTLPSR
jgi:two-component system, chemotaxis family, response regulator Rcp1